MNYKIVADSSCDLSKEMKSNMNIEIVPLKIMIDDKTYIDDNSLDIQSFLQHMKNSDNNPKTSCPSPEQFYKSYEGKEEKVFVVTLSSELSGTYNSAYLAKELYKENNSKLKKIIHVFNSKSASIGETLISMKIFNLIKENISHNAIIEKTCAYIDEMRTFFLLENLQHLAKAGRLKYIAAKIIDVLNIKLVCGSTNEGAIKMFHKARGYKKAFRKLLDTIGEEGINLNEKILGIAHCNCLEKALDFKNEVLKKYNFKDIVVVEMRGLSSTYADQNGLVIAF